LQVISCPVFGGNQTGVAIIPAAEIPLLLTKPQQFNPQSPG